jgi:hypothetical protein
MIVIWLLSIFPLLAIVTTGDAYITASASISAKLGIRKFIELPLLLVLIFLFAACLFILAGLLIRLSAAIDLVQYAHVENGHIIPFTDSELETILQRESDRHAGQYLSPPAALAARTIALFEAFVVMASLPVSLIMAKCRHCPMLVWLPLALLGNVGAIVWLRRRTELKSS